ncbi:hypothetical protein [Pantoea sp. R13S299]|uniref:hypothetical protein n=1 Tax=Pantoea sp. R13S299 TaxID=3402751 RepID=UPI003AEDB2B4
MENQQLSDVKGKELVAAGHAFAKAIGMDTPLIEIAKMVSVLATRLDCALVRGDELQKERDALAAENVALKSAISYVCDTDNQPDYQYDGMGCGIEDRGIIDRYEAARYGWDEALERMYSEVIPCASDIETPATDAYLNAVRAEGVEILTGKLQQLIDEGVFDAKEIGVAAGAVYEGAQIAAQLRAGKDGE